MQAWFAGAAGFARFIAASLAGIAFAAWHGALWIAGRRDDSALLLLAAVEATIRWLGIN